MKGLGMSILRRRCFCGRYMDIVVGHRYLVMPFNKRVRRDVGRYCVVVDNTFQSFNGYLSKKIRVRWEGKPRLNCLDTNKRVGWVLPAYLVPA
jgi:hypothetical protein